MQWLINHWQEVVLGSGQILFILFLIPILRNKNSQLPKITSRLTGYVLILYGFTYLSLNLFYPTITAIIAGCIWLWIADNRALKAKSISNESTLSAEIFP